MSFWYPVRIQYCARLENGDSKAIAISMFLSSVVFRVLKKTMCMKLFLGMLND